MQKLVEFMRQTQPAVERLGGLAVLVADCTCNAVRVQTRNGTVVPPLDQMLRGYDEVAHDLANLAQRLEFSEVTA